MKRNWRAFVAGMTVMALVGVGTVCYGESIQRIEAVFGRVALVVSGQPVAEETLLYNGTTYVPLRAAAEILGMEVSWDGANNRAYIDEAGTDRILAQATPEASGTASAEDGYVAVEIQEILTMGQESMECVTFADGYTLACSLREPTQLLEEVEVYFVIVFRTVEDGYGPVQAPKYPVFTGSYRGQPVAAVSQEQMIKETLSIFPSTTDTSALRTSLTEMSLYNAIDSQEEALGQALGAYYFSGAVDRLDYDDGVHRYSFELKS